MARKEIDPTQEVTLRLLDRLMEYLSTEVYVNNPSIPDENDIDKVYQFIMERVIFYASAEELGVVTFEDYAREIKADMDYALRNNPEYLGCVAPQEEE